MTRYALEKRRISFKKKADGQADAAAGAQAAQLINEMREDRT